VRLVIDTNILINALLTGSSLPAHLIALWREGRFDLLTSPDQLDELMRVTQYPQAVAMMDQLPAIIPRTALTTAPDLRLILIG
jgi:predicted nucleic acid-binding protein